MFLFSAHSKALLATVKPELQAVAVAALGLSTVDFAIVQGNRTLDEQRQLFGEGRTAAECLAAGVPAAFAKPDAQKVTWTLRSNHLNGDAIDVCPVVNGALEWDNDGSKGLWPQIAATFKAASVKTGIRIYWGGDWSGKTKDRPHISLVPG